MHTVSSGRQPDVPSPPQNQIHIPETASPGRSLAHDWLPTWQRLVVISLLFALFVFCSSLAVDYILLVRRDSGDGGGLRCRLFSFTVHANQEHAKEVANIDSAVSRIQWALREILPKM